MSGNKTSPEYFKNNLGIIERNLASDGVEPKKHVEMYLTWFDWIMTNDGVDLHRQYLYQQSIPKSARALLSRTYNEAKDVSSVRQGLLRMLEVTYENLLSPECAELLPVFFDHKQQFYLRHGFPTPKAPLANKRKHASSPKTLPAWKAELEENNCIDCYHLERGWELGVVEEVLTATNKIRVSLPDGVSEFFNLDDDTRIAPYGTKIFPSDGDNLTEAVGGGGDHAEPEPDTVIEISDSEGPMEVEVSDGMPVADEKLSQLAIESSKPSQWRLDLGVGSLVDVKNKAGLWYQGCILELRTLTLAEEKCFDCPNVEMAERGACEVKQTDTDSTCSQDMSVVGSSEVQLEPTAAESKPTENTVSTETTATYARVALLGFSEGCDEWINVYDATTIQPLLSMSGGRRGDLQVREEIIYVVSRAAPGINQVKSIEHSLLKFNHLIVWPISSQNVVGGALEQLFSPIYLGVMEDFYRHGGFRNAVHIIRHSTVPNDHSPPVSLDIVLHLIIAIGAYSPFSPKINPDNTELRTVLTLCLNRVANLSPREIRETSTDLLEQAMGAVEKICVVIIGHTRQSGQVVEAHLLLLLAKLYLSCPYLNRRLWGLKCLTDVIRRNQNAYLAPDGLKKVVTLSPSTTGSAGSGNDSDVNPVEMLKAENVSYRVVKITHFLTAEDICRTITTEGYVTSFFVGESAHASLMQRSSELLRFLAVNGYLPENILMQIWEVGFVSREPAALQVLVDIIQDLKLPSLQYLVETISAVANSTLTVALVDIAAAVGLRLHLSTSSGDTNTSLLSMSADSSATVADELFIRCLLLLWKWGKDGSGVIETCAAKAISKLEYLCGTCMTPVNTLHRVGSFDWNRHWTRTVVVIKQAFEELSLNKSIVPGIKALHACVVAWPKMAHSSAVSSLPVASGLPFLAPTRSCLAEYLETTMSILPLISNVVIRLKTDFFRAVKEINDSVEVPNNQTEWSTCVLSEEVQSVLNNELIGASRFGYRDTLEKCFDFINFFARCSMMGSIRISFDLVEKIWNDVLRKAITVQERDAVISFISRLVQVKIVSTASSPNLNSTEPNPETDSVQLSERYGANYSILLAEDVERVFRCLLCNDNFIESIQLNNNGFACIEKYFRWINANSGLIVEFMGHDAKYMVSKSLSALQGWDVFLQIMLCCQDIAVATLAVKFFTSLVNKLSIPLVEDGEIARHYKMLVDLSMNVLDRLQHEYESYSRKEKPGDGDILMEEDIGVLVPNGDSSVVGMQMLERILSSGESKCDDSEWVLVHDDASDEKRRSLVLQRILMLLSAVLDESATDAGRHNIQSHDVRARSEPVEIKITCSGKKKCIDIKILQMLATDRLGDLLARVEENLVDATLENVKIYHRGKDLTVSSANDRLKTFRDLFFTTTETLMIVERPMPSGQASSSGAVVSSATVGADSNGKDQKHFVSRYTLPLDSLPVSLLSQNESYFGLLFSMLNYTTGELTNTLWALILRLPTSINMYKKWVNLSKQGVDTENVIMELLGVPCISMSQKSVFQSNVPKLVYSLQIIENIMDSDTLTGIDGISMSTPEWVQSFADSCGLNVLVSTLAIAKEQVRQFLCESSIVGQGASGAMLLQALHGLTKLIRFFFIVICNSTSMSFSATIAPLLKNSKVRELAITGDLATSAIGCKPPDTQAKKSGTYVEDLTVEDFFDGPAILLPAVEDKVPDSKMDVTIDTSAITADNVFSKEWGVKYLSTTKFSVPSKELLSNCQKTVLEVLANLRGYCDTLYDTLDSTKAVSKSAAISSNFTAEETHLFGCAEDLLVMWGILLIADPSVSEEMDKDLLLALLQSFCRGAHSTVSFPARFTAWFMKAIGDIFALLKESNRNHCAVFCEKVLTTALLLRPTLENASSPSSVEIKHPIPEIDIIYQMIVLSDDLDTGLLATSARSDLGVKLFTELQQHAAGGVCKNKSFENAVLNGTLKLLCILAKGHDEVLVMLHDLDIVPFLLEIGLGLQKTNKVLNTAIFTESDSKLLAYSLLLILCDWRADIAEQISEKVRQIHVYAIDALRLSEEPQARSSKISDSSNKELIKSAFRPERDIRSPVGYSGIRNMGCTCYMNSLLQVLYMIPEVKSGVLNFPVDTGLMTEEAIADNLVLQLQRMFIYLSNSQRKAYSPESWTAAYKDETGVCPINVAQQQDAQEFLQVLCERLENQPFYLKPASAVSVSEESVGANMEIDGAETKSGDMSRQPKIPPFDIMQKAFGGKLSNQMMRAGSESDIREKDESFVCISLDVAGTTGLENSLNKFVAGETISDFQWDEGKPRETIVKRQCLSELSNTIIFHLKRFELNFDTFLREKVNDVFPFPTFLNLYPYSKEGLAAQISGNKDNGRPASYYQYELQGIVEHTGTTDSGHYFSYIRETESFALSADNDSKKRWIEFNDSEVSLFSESMIPSECFGGKTTTYDVSSKDIVQRQSANPKNAYMLVYRRMHPVSLSDTASRDSAVVENTDQSVDPFEGKICDEIESDNRRHLLCTRVFTKQHIEFMTGLFDTFKASGGLSKSTWTKEGQYVGKESTILEDFVQFSFKIAARTVEHALYTSLSNRIIECVSDRASTTDLGSKNKKNIPAEVLASVPMDQSIDEEEAAALALSVSLHEGSSGESAETVAPNIARDDLNRANFATTSSRAVVSTDILNLLLSDFDSICGLLYHTESATRMVTAKFLLKFFSILACDSDALTPSVLKAIPKDVWKDGTISSTQITVNADMEVEAGILSVRGGGDSAAAAEAALVSFVSNSASAGNLCVKLLLELTKDDKVQAIAEYWRRSDAMCWLLHQLTLVNWQTRYVLAKRELILGICDVFLGNQSVTGGGMFVQASRKRAPSSYVHVPHTKPNAVNAFAKNIPDWSLLLDALAVLVTRPLTTEPGLSSQLDDLSMNSIMSKVLYSTGLKQSRYCLAISKVACFLCFQNMNMSTCISETISEALSMCSCDAVYHVFNFMSIFLAINDSLTIHRVASLFFGGSQSILDMAKDVQESRSAFVSVFITSVMEIAEKNINVFNNLSSSMMRIENWAGWMLKFSYQYQVKTRTEAESLAALKGNKEPGAESAKSVADNGDAASTVKATTSSPAPKGPYLPIYGEPESSFETLSVERAEMCFQKLRSMLIRMGANPDSLIPDDAFIELPPDDAAIGAAFDVDDPIVIDGETISPAGGGLSDHMTDEEFARYLQSQEQ